MKLQEIANIYVKSSDSFIYKIVSHELVNNGTLCYRYNLELIAGYDYIDPDNSDRQGYVTADNFIANVQTDIIIVYPLEQTLTEELKDNGYTVIKQLPVIH